MATGGTMPKFLGGPNLQQWSIIMSFSTQDTK